MGSPSFDRQVFVKRKEPQKPPSRSPLPGAFALLVVAALSAFATYRYVKAGGKLPTDSADKAQIAQLQTKLKKTEARVKELERQRRRDPVRHVAAKTDPHSSAPKATSTNELLAEDAPHMSRAADGTLKPSGAAKTFSLHPAAKSKAASSTPAEAETSKLKGPETDSKTLLASTQPTVPSKELNTLQGNMQANHQDWQATVNRLGNVVGELDSQRTALQKTQSGVNYLLKRVQRANVPFTLHKGSRFQRVGPISMKLASDSVKGQHYTIRMVVDDKSVVLKDRALNEIIEFYTSQSKYPLRLIVSNIQRDEVSGTLAVPPNLDQTQYANPQLQQR